MGLPVSPRSPASQDDRSRDEAFSAPASPQLATRQHVEKRYERDEAEYGPGQFRAAADIPAGGQVNPHQDHGNGMEEADQEFEDLLHCLNLPGPLWVPVRSLPGSAPIRLTWLAGPHES